NTSSYILVSGDKVILYAKIFLDEHLPLKTASHQDAASYTIDDGKLVVILQNGKTTGLKNAVQFAGYQGPSDEPETILLRNNGLHVEIQIDREDAIGKTDPAGVEDIFLESATTSNMDCEDSVAAVDAEDKTLVDNISLGLN